MKQIKIFDTTLRDGEQSPGCSMHLSEKLELALQLEKLGVDIIEAGFAIASPGDSESVEAVAKIIKNCTVASLARSLEKDIDAAYNAVKHAVSPRIHIFLATSPIHMEYKLKMSQEDVLARVAASAKYAKKYVSDVEFSAEDASRSELPFLAKVCETAIKNGATVLNIPDTTGYSTPQEMFNIITYLKNNVKGIEKVDISAHNHNDLGLGVANSLSMILAGATQIECTVNGIGERAGNASLEEIVMGLRTRKAFYNAGTRINAKEIYTTCRMLSNITNIAIQPTKPIVGANAFAHESGIHQHGVLANPITYEIMSPEEVGVPENKIVLGKHSGKHAFAEHAKALGYSLSAEELQAFFDNFKALADRKKYVSDKDVAALLCGKKIAKQETYSLKDFKAKCSSMSAETTVELMCGSVLKSATSKGDGPVDSAYKAINAVLERQIELISYNLSSVTEGRDAQAEANITLDFEGVKAKGRAVSTDVLQASILAYIDGVNKLL